MQQIAIHFEDSYSKALLRVFNIATSSCKKM